MPDTGSNGEDCVQKAFFDYPYTVITRIPRLPVHPDHHAAAKGSFAPTPESLPLRSPVALAWRSGFAESLSVCFEENALMVKH